MDKPRKKRGRPRGCTDKKSILKKNAMLSVIENTDMSQSQIAQAFGVTPAIATRVKDDAERIKKLTIQTPQMQRLAVKQVKACLQQKPITRTITTKSGEVITYDHYPDFADIDRAVGRVLDRTEPKITKIQSESMSISLEINPIDYDKYRQPIQDVVHPTPVVVQESTPSIPKQ